MLYPVVKSIFFDSSMTRLENQIYLVTSSYDMKSGVFNHVGDLVAEASSEEPVIVSKIDLNQHTYWPWLGDLKNRIPREIPSQE